MSYANVMSTIAVVLAIGTGSAYAAATIGSEEIVDGSVASVDVKNGSLMASDVKNESLTGQDLASKTITARSLVDGAVEGRKLAPGAVTGDKVPENALTGADVDEGSLGNVPSASEAAHATSAGHATQAGKAPVEGYQVVYRQADFDNTVDKEETVDVPCPSGKRPIGGGGFTYTGAFEPAGNEVAIKGSYPTGYTYGPDDNRPDSWRVIAEATDRATYHSVIYITGYAICAKTDMP